MPKNVLTHSIETYSPSSAITPSLPPSHLPIFRPLSLPPSFRSSHFSCLCLACFFLFVQLSPSLLFLSFPPYSLSSFPLQFPFLVPLFIPSSISSPSLIDFYITSLPPFLPPSLPPSYLSTLTLLSSSVLTYLAMLPTSLPLSLPRQYLYPFPYLLPSLP